MRPGGNQLRPINESGQSSERNPGQSQLRQIIIRDLTLEDKKALEEIANYNKNNLVRMFAGKKLTLKKNAGYGLQDSNKDQSSNSGGQDNDKTPVSNILDKLFGSGTSLGMQNVLGEEFTSTVIPIAIPLIGAFESGGNAIVAAGQALKGLYQKHKMSAASDSYAPGDPAAAFDAIMNIQTREIKKYETNASIYTVSALSQLAAFQIDFGIISSIAVKSGESIALRLHKLYLIHRDYKEMEEANVLLQQGPINLNLFKTCPLLGCYLIGNSDTSSVLNMAVQDYGKIDWMFNVETMVAKAQPVFKKSREVILKSRYTIKELENQKGSVANISTKKGKLQSLIGQVSLMIGSA
jgi:hypothetical protein